MIDDHTTMHRDGDRLIGDQAADADAEDHTERQGEQCAGDGGDDVGAQQVDVNVASLQPRRRDGNGEYSGDRCKHHTEDASC